MNRRGLISFIPGAVSLMAFLIVLIVVSVVLLEVSPKVEMDTKTTVDKHNYQSYTTMNALLVKDEGKMVELVREYGNAGNPRQQEIESAIIKMVEKDLSRAEDPRLKIEFENGDRIDAGDGAITTARTMIATPDGKARVQFGLSGIKEADGGGGS